MRPKEEGPSQVEVEAYDYPVDKVIHQILEVQQGGVIKLRSPELKPGSCVEVIVMPILPKLDRPSLYSYRGIGKGVYDTPDQADAFIRSERDHWDR
jgi:hypothetical protein